MLTMADDSALWGHVNDEFSIGTIITGFPTKVLI